ncbi:hypothetical protein D3C76_1621510 [compost metagenome]
MERSQRGQQVISGGHSGLPMGRLEGERIGSFGAQWAYAEGVAALPAVDPWRGKF